MKSSLSNLALSSEELISPTEQLRRDLQRNRAAASSAAATASAHRPVVHAAAAAASSSSAMFPMSQETAFSQASSGWSSVTYDETHLRGSVVQVCGGKVRMDLRIEGAVPIMQEIGPFDSLEKLQDGTAELHRELASHNRRFECYTNGYGFQEPDHETVRMFLDADFSEDGSRTVLFDAEHLQHVLKRHWGAKKLKTNGKWYAFSKDEEGRVIWLHEYILNQRGASLVDFDNKNTRDCRESNLTTTKLVQTLFRPSELIWVSRDPSRKDPGGFTNLIYEPSGSRWKFTWKVGDKVEHKYFKASKDSQAAKEEALGFREARIVEQEQQEKDNASFKKAWVHQPWLLAEMNQSDACIPGLVKNPFPVAKSANSLNVGPWLRGSIQKHAEGLWCAKLGEIFIHSDTKATALRELLAVNIQRNVSVNSHGTRMEKGEKVRCILLEGCPPGVVFEGGIAMFVVSDNDKVAAALSDHAWKVNITDSTNEKVTNWEAVNLDPSSPWQRAEDLVAFVKLQDLKSLANEPLIKNAHDFFRVVSIKKRARTWDCRFGTIECALKDQDSIHVQEKRKQENAIKRGKEAKPSKVECVDSLGYMKLSQWTSAPSSAPPPVSSPMALAAVEAINSGAALFDGPEDEAALVRRANAVAASSMGDIEEEEDD